MRKIIIKDKLYECPTCGYRWEDDNDLPFDKDKHSHYCPNCKELIKDKKDTSISATEMKDIFTEEIPLAFHMKPLSKLNAGIYEFHKEKNKITLDLGKIK